MVWKGIFRLAYEIGKKTIPVKNTGILVFKEMFHAKYFRTSIGHSFPRTKILIGSGKERKLGVRSSTLECNAADDPVAIEIFQKWKTDRSANHADWQAAWSDWPIGTIALDWFVPEGEFPSEFITGE